MLPLKRYPLNPHAQRRTTTIAHPFQVQAMFRKEHAPEALSNLISGLLCVTSISLEAICEHKRSHLPGRPRKNSQRGSTTNNACIDAYLDVDNLARHFGILAPEWWSDGRVVNNDDGRVAEECGGGGEVGRMREQTRWAGRRASRGQFME